ncbi:MAG: ABC transporter permease [Sphingobium sp.]|nr:ABC transporter permease [Sphingobium sp.]MBP9156513.1 ABC transporter permease [Sphingobium sp.]
MNRQVLASLRIQGRVINALLFREIITRYGRSNIGLLWLVAEPMLFTIGIATLWYAVKLHTVSAIPIISFALTGYSSVLIWRNSVNRSLNAISINISLLYHKNVRAIDIFCSRAILEIVGGTCSFFILSVVLFVTGHIDYPSDLSILVTGWLLLCWFAWALSLTIGALSEVSDTLERIWHVITYLMFPLSGAVFMVDWLPTPAQHAVYWLPMVHGVEMVRHGFFGDKVITHEDPLYFIVVNLILTIFGLTAVSYVQSRVKPE